MESDLDFSSAILIVATILSPTTEKNVRSINVLILNQKFVATLNKLTHLKVFLVRKFDKKYPTLRNGINKNSEFQIPTSELRISTNVCVPDRCLHTILQNISFASCEKASINQMLSLLAGRF